ncbi:MAG: DUF378 domain-containing protein [Nanoarchaeota archaeon]|nr:DUF378 domain-containing protein [Nanoarchaeota archaeon]
MNKLLDKIVLIIAAIGAINWGLATLDYDLVNLIVGSWPTIESVVYYIIALCGIWALIKVFKK